MKNVTYINAGAGSGKTYRLTETLTNLIKSEKVKPEQVILTTFTTKAANEFKEKAKAFLYDEGLYDAAMQLDHAMIGTVHSVCQRMIDKYWFNLGLSPNMGVMAEEDTAYYISQSLSELPTDEELKVLHGFARYFDIRVKDGYIVKKAVNYDFWQDHLKAVIGFATNYELEDFKQSEEESLNFIRKFVKADTNCSFTFDELKAVIAEHETFLRSRKQSDANDKRIKALEQAQRHLNSPSLGVLRNIDSTIGSPKGYGMLAENFHNRMAGIWTSQMVYDKQEKYIRLIFDLAQRWKENFAQFKRDKNLLDYNDMEKYMRLLMMNEDIASEISQSYRYLFVDEFQDSSPIQVKIFDALSDLMEHSYWVGDYKQAIYGFRGSDIALTKAVVDRVSKKESGCDTDTLDTSWRSLPDIVELNNDVFRKTFADVLEEKNICLKQHRKNENHEESLLYFVSSDEYGIAEHVLKLLNQGIKPNEIAVLARANATLAEVASQLKQYKIPSSREDSPIIDSFAYSLTSSLLRIVGSTRDSLAKATVAILTEEDYNTRTIIEEKILNDACDNAKTEDCLAQVPLIRRLMTIRPKLQQQSVASLVESMIILLDLFNEVKKVETDAMFGIACLQIIINTARVYEEHCVQMNLPATIDGFIAYIETVSPTGMGDAKGVQLHTYHSCKGLQWKYVILMSLNTNVSDLKKAVRGETYGVHPVHVEEPTAEYPYPKVFVRLTPWIYGTDRNVPDEISSVIEESAGFKQAYKAMLSETNRVLYVGMTRPQDVLILNIEKPKKGGKLLQWPKDNGVDTASESIPEQGDWDVFGTGHIFKDFTLTQEEFDKQENYGDTDSTLSMRLNIEEPDFRTKEPRYISPSHIRKCGKIGKFYEFEHRIPISNNPGDMATVGNCIHQIFAIIEDNPSVNGTILNNIIRSYGLSAVLTDTDSILSAWKKLYDKLVLLHGKPVKTYHERPFRMDYDGQTIVGSIDLVWQTQEGNILVDFKNNPMAAKYILDPDNEHFAGWYAGQLDAYQDALEAAGENILQRYIYYPVRGLLVEI
ncbi:MAG: UvrD-helicase domain-containing protein [Candidatus Phocaeicola faecipullorum]|nr:UvrD-helicase domain-containing protein [Candidatus Phocaeicola faecipullorum]